MNTNSDHALAQLNGRRRMIHYFLLLVVFVFRQANSQSNTNSITIPLDSIIGRWTYVGNGVPRSEMPRLNLGWWRFDTFCIIKANNAIVAKRFNNKHVKNMAERGYFANSFVTPTSNGRAIDSMIFYHRHTNSLGEHTVQYYGSRAKDEVVIRLLTADTIYMSRYSSLCKSCSRSVDSISYIFVKSKDL